MNRACRHPKPQKVALVEVNFDTWATVQRSERKHGACPVTGRQKLECDASKRQIIHRIAGNLQKPERGKHGPFPGAWSSDFNSPEP